MCPWMRLRWNSSTYTRLDKARAPPQALRVSPCDDAKAVRHRCCVDRPREKGENQSLTVLQYPVRLFGQGWRLSWGSDYNGARPPNGWPVTPALARLTPPADRRSQRIRSPSPSSLWVGAGYGPPHSHQGKSLVPPSALLWTPIPSAFSMRSNSACCVLDSESSFVANSISMLT